MSYSISLNDLRIPSAESCLEMLGAIVRKREIPLDARFQEKSALINEYFQQYTQVFQILSNYTPNDKNDEKLQLKKITDLHNELKLLSSKSKEAQSSMSSLIKQATGLQKSIKPGVEYFNNTGGHFRTVSSAVKPDDSLTGYHFKFSPNVQEALRDLLDDKVASRLKVQIWFHHYDKKRNFFNFLQNSVSKLKSTKGKEPISSEEFQSHIQNIISDFQGWFDLLDNQRREEIVNVSKDFSGDGIKKNLKNLLKALVVENQSDLQFMFHSVPQFFASPATTFPALSEIASSIGFLTFLYNRYNDSEKPEQQKQYLEDLECLKQTKRFLDPYGLARAEKVINEKSSLEMLTGLASVLEETVQGTAFIAEGVLTKEAMSAKGVLSQWYKHFAQFDCQRIFDYQVDELFNHYQRLERSTANEAQILCIEFLLFLKISPEQMEALYCPAGTTSQEELARNYGMLSYLAHKHIAYIQNDSDRFGIVQEKLEGNFKRRSELFPISSSMRKNYSINVAEGLVRHIGKGDTKKLLPLHADSLFRKSAELFRAIPPEKVYEGDLSEDEHYQQYIDLFEKTMRFAFAKCIECDDEQQRADILLYFLQLANELLQRGEVTISQAFSLNPMLVRDNIFQRESELLKKNTDYIKLESILKMFHEQSGNYKYLRAFQDGRIARKEILIPNLPLRSKYSTFNEERKTPYGMLVMGEFFLREQAIIHYWLLTDVCHGIESQKMWSSQEIEALIQKDKDRKKLKIEMRERSRSGSAPSTPRSGPSTPRS